MNDSPLGLFGKYLTLWVAISIVIGIILGNLFASLFYFIASIQYENVNFIVGIANKTKHKFHN